MHQNTFDGRAPPEPAGGSYAFLKIPSRSGGLLIRKGMEGEGPTSKGDRREGREERGDGKGGQGIPPPPKVKVSRLNTARYVTSH